MYFFISKSFKLMKNFLTKKSLLSAFFAITIFNISLAQKFTLVFSDDFKNNKHQWFVGTQNYGSAQIKKGLYILTNTSDQYVYRFWNNIDSLMYFKAYKLIVRLKAEPDNDPNFEYGLFWDSKQNSAINELRISNNNFSIISRTNQIQTPKLILSPRNCPLLHEPGQYNTLKIFRHSNYYDILINNVLCSRLSIQRMGIKGNQIGFYISGKGQLIIDKIQIFAQKRKFNKVYNYFLGKRILLGPSINTFGSEVAPLISPNGDKLFFVRRYYSFGSSDNIWFSKLDTLTNTWSAPTKMPSPFNNSHNNAIVYVSPDENSFVILGRYDGQGHFIDNSGISLIYKMQNGQWSKPKQIIIADYDNSWIYQNFCFSADRRILIIAAKIPGKNFGGSDLYICHLQPDGSYSSPQNLGADINTAFNEGTPYLAVDGRTLYFSSSGYPGYGQRDIFVSRRLDNSWLHWSKPKNLGPQVNSPGWDGYFSIDIKTGYAYLVSTINNDREDIYKVKISPDAMPVSVAFVSGQVTDSTSGKKLYCHIYYYNNGSTQLNNGTISDPLTGQFELILPLGYVYFLNFIAKGYLPKTIKINLTEQKNTVNKSLKILLSPIKRREHLVLNNIYFVTGKAIVRPISYVELSKLLYFMQANPKMKILISGHTNNIGPHQFLMELSKQRAKAIKEYLVEHGISPSRIKTIGYGPDRPIASNATEQGRLKNQRVEIKILSF